MMLAIANEKIMREVKESLTTAVGCSEAALVGISTQKPHTTLPTQLPSCVQKPRQRNVVSPWGWAEFQLSQFWRNKFHIFENNQYHSASHIEPNGPVRTIDAGRKYSKMAI